MKRTPVIALVAAAAVAAASVAYAAIPAANGTISACKDSKGALKVIDVEAGQACSGSQQLLAWSQQGPAGPQGPAGAQGPAGPQGAQGLQGAPGISGYQIVHADSPSDDTDRTKEATAYCPAGKRPLGGGHVLTDGWTPDDDYTLTESSPAAGLLPGWRVRVTWEGVGALEMTSWSVRAYAICASVA
jgi:hypothetical protein